MNKLKLLYAFLLITISHTFAQNTGDFIPPLDNLRLVSTFGELRPDHLHSGVDFSGFHRIGLPVYAADSGYISRIKVSASGYGNALYITHPNGLKTVYGHLDRFAPEIQDYVTKKQYEIKSFEIILYPIPWELKVKRGQIIGYVGNSGRSYAPHLHFEVRDALLDYPLNPLLLGFKIVDTKPPVITKIAVYPASDTSLLNFSHKKLILPASGSFTIKTYGPVYFGIETYDFVNNHYSRKGVYSVKLYIDDTLQLWYKFDKFFFQNTRYVNTLLDYPEYIKRRIKLQRSYISPNNKLTIYKVCKTNGTFNLAPGKHKITYIAADIYGNKTKFTFYTYALKNAKTSPQFHKGTLVHWDKKYTLGTLDFKLKIPAYALYDTTYLNFSIINNHNCPGAISLCYRIHNQLTPLQKPLSVAFTVNDTTIPAQKLVIARINRNGSISALKTEIDSSASGRFYKNDPLINSAPQSRTIPINTGQTVIKAYSDKFGIFYVTADTVKPYVSMITPAKTYSGNKIAFKIKDNLSGIDTYNVLVNGNWTLFAYDEKTSTLKTVADTTHFTLGTNELEIIITDNAGNITDKNYKIYIHK